MKFCDNCGNLFRIEIEDSNRFFFCRSCKTKRPVTEDITIGMTSNNEVEKIVVIDEKEQNTFPVTEILCPKCGEVREANWSMQQTRGGDEPPTRFYHCKTCDWRWREYS